MTSNVTLAGLTLAQRIELLSLARARDLARRGSELPPIERADRDGRLPLSFAQQRLWFLAQLRDLGSTYHIPRRLRLRGDLDREALGRALDRIVARHEALRTTFAEVDGVPEQRIAPADVGFHLAEHELTGQPDAAAELERLAEEEAHAPFDLARGPLIRGRLVRLGADDHVLLLTMHHIVSDAWSMGVLTRELGALYDAFRRGDADPLPAPPVQYADYALWQRRWVEGDVLQAQAEYWTRTLGDAPELLELPADRARPAEMDPSAAHVAVVLDAELTAALKALSRRSGTTLFMTLLAGWAAVLSRLSGQDDVVVGTPAAGRGRPEIEGLIGFFVNTLALRVDLAGAPTVAELLERVKHRALQAQQHQDIPFEQVVERVRPARSLSHTPVFQVLFAWQDAAEGGTPSLAGLEVDRTAPTSSQAQATRDLVLSLREAGGRIVGSVAYATALFDGASVERWVGYLRRALREMAADETQPVDRLAILPADERTRVLEAWNRTEADWPRGSCIHELIQAQAARTPDAPAVVSGDETLTYAALNAGANRLAHHLRALGVGPDARVAICMERGPETLVGLLAVLKAGGAYVPLDPEYPAERLATMLADSAPAVVLTQARLRDRVAAAAAPVLALDDASPAWAERPATDPARGGLTPEHLAYVIYTSGSTGMPKGVGVPHRAMAAMLGWTQRTWALEADEAVLQRISLSFDVSVRELFWPLTTGARVVLAPAGHGDPDVLVETIAREGIGVVHMVPSLLQPFLEHPRLGECARLTRVMCGGEVLSPALARRFRERLPHAALYHMYGPTETTLAVTAARCEAEETDGRLPLGRPVANTRLYVLDARGEPAPLGAAGELYVGGAQVARGYLDRPEQTAERFVADPFCGQPGARMYRTGDRVRWRPDGELEFLGRVDHQVKVRGFRIELGEIEARLAKHPAVREAVVVARDDTPGDTRLVAYVVAGGETAGVDVLRAYLGETLPEHMVPAAYVRMDALPLTPNGKVDRKALPAPDADAYAARAYEPPAGDTEQALAEIWAEVLGVERVGRGDDFFGLGGHSLLAVQVISRVRQVLEVEVALREIFTRPTLREFARALDAAARAQLPPIEPAPRGDRVPLSFGQQRLWFLEQLGNLGSTHHMSKRQRLRGDLDRAALVRALDALVARHEALRTTFAQVDGVPEQRVAPADAGFHLVEHDLAGRDDAESALRAIVAEDGGAPFDLERGPLIRGRLVRLAPDDHLLLITMHHIVSDGWSMGVLTRELTALYDAFRRGEASPLPPLPIQYADFAAWQRRWVDGRVLQEQADYWTRTLGGAPELLELPTDRPRPALVDRGGAQLRVVLDEELTAGLKALSRRHGTTLYMTLLAGWATVLGRLSGQDDVVVGSPMAGRDRRETEGLIGFFVNTLALRLDLSGAPTAAELLRRVKERALEAQHHQDIPFEQVVDLVAPARTLAHHPLFQVTFAWQNTPRGAGEGLPLPGLQPDRIGVAASEVNASVDLWLGLREWGGRIAGAVTYATALFDRETVERHVGYLRRVLREMVADDARPVARLPLLPDAERARVVETWNATGADYPAASCIHELFERQVERAPDATAVLSGDERMSYADLNARANRLAHHLRALGVRPEVRVAICVERGPEMVTAVLAVLKAGGAYVPLDPAYPVDRLRYMLADSSPAVLLTHGALAEPFAETGVPVVDLETASAAWTDGPDTDPARDGLSPEHPAYIIYTSGSTGRPKGVLVPHRGLCNVAAAQQRAFGVGPDDRVLQFASLSFDAAAFELVMALASGAALCVASREELLPGPGLLALLRHHEITTVTLPPSALAALPVEELPALRNITTAGEALPAELVARWGVRHRLWNLYGPTEATIWSTAAACGDPARKPDIGAPIANVRAYVLDDAMEPVPIGAAGELYVGGAGVARGYLGRPGLTAERFVPDPFGGDSGARLYRTGDRVRWLAGGTLDFLGRIDHQVKLRGYRIELGEIESRLMEHPAVRDAVVIAREDTPGDTRLVAYVVGDVGADVLRAHLAEALPEYMVPAAYLRLDALPTTPNGKLDRKALPSPEGDAYARRAYEAPVGETEEMLAQLWIEVLGVEHVSRWDDFFELGGHSLLAVQMIALLEMEIDLGELFAKPVLHDFARELEKTGRAELPPIEPAAREGSIPLSFAQTRLWFLEQLGNLGSAYHIPTSLRLRGELDREALMRALDGIVARHEALRTVFAQVDGAPEQRIAPVEASRFHLLQHDLSGAADAEAELGRLRREEASAPFNLERGPLIRGRLIRVAADDHVLLLTMHHIVSDGWSMGVLTRELSTLYAAHREGRAADLTALPVQYADYAAWQRRWVEGDVLREQADYWTRTLGGAPELLELPTDRPRPARMDPAGATLRVELDEALTAGLQALSRRHGTTLFMTVLAGWATVLSRLSGQDDVVVGTPSAGRGRREIEGLIGFFVNTLAIRVDVSGAPTVADLLERVKERALGAQDHQDIPFEQVVERLDPARSLSHTPLFQVLFTWQNTLQERPELPGVELVPLQGPALEVAKFDLSLNLRETGDRIAGSITYATALFERETVERWAGYLRRVLREMAADDTRPIDALELLSDAERAQVLEGWNATDAPYPADACLHALVEAQVGRTPNATAIVANGETLTYAELNRRANRLARHLRTLGVGPDVRVGICLERGPEMVAAVLAVLKAGGAYVSLDPSYPADRLAYMLADSAPAAVLTQRSLQDRVEHAGVPVIALDADAPAWTSMPSTNPVVGGLGSHHLAYLIYTSGSTGRPKGVAIEHRNAVNLLGWAGAAFDAGEMERTLFSTSLNFDLSIFELFAPLSRGAAVWLVDDAVALLRSPADVTLVNTVPSAMRALLDAGAVPASVRTVNLAGEPLPEALVERVFAETTVERVFNLYGPSETTTYSTGVAMRRADGFAPHIGTPLQNTRVYILDAAGQPVPVGVSGELYIGGAGVARGYLGRPEMTAERFVADPFSRETGARMYRTGDLARWRPDGAIEYLGRIDHQVKVRGFRIELGEIEARLREHAAVREAVVVAREDAPGQTRLVAYVVGDAGADVLRAHLGETLPEYMVPAAYVRLDALPLTPNGKVDRKALPAPEGDAYARHAYEPPVSETERAVAEIWGEVLGLERVSRHDNFFDLGGHSLLAMQVISRVRKVLHADVALGALFTRPALHDFAREMEKAGRAELPPIQPAARDGSLPLSFAQTRLWFLEQLGNLGSAYHIPTSMRLRGDLDRDALVRALDRIVARHEALRTTFAQVDGAPEQRIAPADVGFHLIEHDLAGQLGGETDLDRVRVEEARAPFDLQRGPLIRGRLIRVAADDHVLLLTMHHIVSDGWSMGVLTRELGALYAAFHRGEPDPLPALPVQYADFAAWQRRWVEGEVLREQSDYWTRTLSGAPELLALPTDRPRPARTDHTGTVLSLELDEEVTAGLKALGRRHGTTLYMTLLAGWAAVLGRLSGQDDVVIGTPTAGRGRREIEELIGFFVNTLAVRVDLSGAPSVADLLKRVKERALDAQHHQDIPFEQVVERVAPARSLSHSPLFQVMFTWQEMTRDGGLALPGLDVGRVGAASLDVQAKYDLSLSLREADGRIVGGITYAASLFERETVERWASYLRRVLREMAAGEHRAVARLTLLSGDERAQVLDEWNETDAPYPADVCLHALIERQAERTPDATALVFEGEPLPFTELNARANRLAHHLRTLGVGPDVRVGICLERSLEMMVGLLGVLKAGGAYVPLDPAYPADRLRYMLADSAPAAVLTQASLRDRVAHADVPVLALDADAPAWARQPATNPGRGALTPDHLAYVIYTSGSTGRPKGVEVHHRGVVNRLAWMPEFHGLDARDVVLQKTPYSFDVSVWELFWPLAAGTRLVIARPDGHRDPAYLAELIRRERVTTVHFVPSLLGAFLEHPECARGTALRRVVTSGEALPAELVARFGERLPGVELHNLYGPTEAAVDVTAWKCTTDGSETRVPIGRPVANTRIYLLDPAGEPVPVGVAGELHIGGVQVARGYQGRPEMTAERFVADPFSREAGARMYRTGDLARWRPDGAIEYLGRIDHQVKVRGFRIELGEIEARLREHAAVREAVVVAREDTPGDARLVAYVVAGEEAGAEVLRAHLGETLPAHMVPAAYVRLDGLPLSPNGKVDRRALPAPEGEAYSARAYEAPVGETEEMLARLWGEVLGVERLSRWDDFFERGGHSLLAVQVIARLGMAIDLGELFSRPVLHDFAREMEKAGRAELPPIQPAAREGSIPLSFAQQRLWFLEQLGSLGSAYHIPTSMRLRGDLDRVALMRALDGIVARHEALRTVFAQVDGAPEQRIAQADVGFHLIEHDLAGQLGGEADLDRVRVEEARAPFDLQRGPLIRGRLIRVAADDHVLLLTMHHIVSDGWSMGVLTRELGALYGAFRRGEPDPLPALPVQYADFAAWQRRWVDGDVLREQSDYWTRTLSGAPELLALPTDRKRPARTDHTGAVLLLELDEEVTAGLKALGRRHGTTLYMTLLAGWAAVLGRLAGQDDVVIGTPTAGRGRREIEELIGFFVNTLAVRVDLSGAPTVADLLGRVKERALGAQHHQDIPFEQVVERVAPARSLSHSPLFQVMFAWQNTPGVGEKSLPGLEVGGVGAGSLDVHAKFDLSLSLREAHGRIVGGITYAASLFERETVERWAGYLRRVLREMAADDTRPVDALELLSDAERAQVLEGWNATDAPYPADACLHTLVEAQVGRTPNATALVASGETLTYAELNRRANRVAHHLRTLGVGPDVRVGICLERGPEMISAVLAVLKAGGAYVSLDPSYPADRLAYMLADSAPAAVLTQASLRDRVEHAGVPVIALDADAPAWTSMPSTNPRVEGLRSDHLAYLIYTSGSTGRPKGVAIEHRNAVNLLGWAGSAFDAGEMERTLFSTSLNFDLSIFELFAPVARGAAVWLVDDAVALLRSPADVTLVNTVPSAMRALLDAGALPASVRTVNLAGEPLPESLVERVFAETTVERVFNLYGPSETTTYSTGVAMRRADGFAPHIGTPLQNTRVYILDAARQPVPVGVSGELYIGGAGVARGYLGRPELTAERFVADPFVEASGARMYRTGDLARWRPDGAIEYLGRIDHQVKVRGFRIELGEIEARLREHAAVREAVVIAREDAPGQTRLVAYVVGDAGADVLRAHLGETLPEYMVPAAYVHLDALPLTPNGKVDRKALPSPEGDAFARHAFEAPVGETEERLARVWGDVLGVERVSRWDDFFELGGHSLLAVRMLALLEMQVDLGELFSRPVLHDFARELEKTGRATLPPITPAAREGSVALSFAQQRLWFLEQLGNLGGAYHIPMRRRLRGELDREALVRALDGIVARHEALRTVFAEVDGAAEQRIASADIGFHLIEHDLTAAADAEAELGRLMAEEARAPFDLERGPLIRGRLIRLAADDHVLVLTMHHIVSDGWSMGVLTRELGALYAAHREGRVADLPQLPVQYADYAAWQRRWVEGDVLREQADYWTRTLGGAPELLELPTDRPRPARIDPAGATLRVELDEALTAGLQALSRRHGTTLFMTLLAGWATVLSRLSGQDDVVIGTPSANRGRREIEGLIGFFVNTLAIRVDVSGAPTVTDLLERVRERALGAQHHQDIPFEQVVERLDPARSLSHTPLFQALFTWQNAGGDGLSMPGLEVGGVGAASLDVQAKFDLSLSLQEAGDRIAGSLTYATALFDRETVERWAGYLRRALEQMAADDTRPVDGLELLSDAERARLVEEWNRTDAAYPADRCVHQLIEAQVARTPDAAAVVSDGETLTYAELNARANRLAHHLAAHGVGPDVTVGICLKRSPEMVVAVLAVLKAGGAYLPLEPEYPADRLRYMLEDARPAVLLTQSALRDRVSAPEMPVVSLDTDAGAWADLPASNPAPAGLTPEHLAYVIYTSGSTGRPKGVQVRHGGVTNYVCYARERYAPDATAFALSSSLAFDLTVTALYVPLLTGGRIVVLPKEEAERALPEALARHDVRVAKFTPAHLASFTRDELARLQVERMVVGGEQLSTHLARAVHEATAGRCEIFNEYGPTEATVGCVVYRSTAGDDEAGAAVPIGRPMSNARVYVLDAAGRPVPTGAVGELYVGGVGVARGYGNRPALTAERFVPDPWGQPGARLYRTGDLARWRSDGEMEFLGRTDFQVKVRGFRIEPGEIEAALLEHPAVREAVVLARGAGGDARLVAYYVAEQRVDVETLRAHLRARLPEHMVPAAYVWLPALPLTRNGKVDRGALPAPDGESFARHGHEAPMGETEVRLAEIWAEVLGTERVGRGDNFFALGGHSLLAVRVVARVRQALGVEVALGDVFAHPTVEALAARVRGTEGRSDEDRAIAIRPAGSRPPLFLVHEGAGSIAYAQVLHPHIDPEVPVYALPAQPISHAPLRTVEGMAARLVRMIRQVQPTGPYRVAGWSFGGALAYEVASQLIGADEAVEFVGMIDTFHPAHPRLASRDATDGNGAHPHAARASGGVDAGASGEADREAAVLDDAEMDAFLARGRAEGRLTTQVTAAQLRDMRDHQRTLREYRPQPIPVAVHQFPAAESPEADPSRGWAAVVPASLLHVIPVPGTHLSMMSAPHAEALGAALSRRLNAPRPGGGPGGRDVSPLMKLRGGTPGAAPLFCVPGAGTTVASFLEFTGCVDPSWPVHALQPRGMDGATVPHATVAAAAEHYLRAVHEACPEGPLHLLGHSYGGWVAFEMALRLRAAGRPVASLTIVDSDAPDEDDAFIREYDGLEAFLKLVEILELTAERSLGISPADARARDEAGRLELLHGRMLRHGLISARSTHQALYGPLRTFARALRTTYRPSGVDPGPLRLVLVDDPRRDADANRAQVAKTLQGWRRWAPGLRFSPGAGNHVTALKTPHVASLAACLAEDRGTPNTTPPHTDASISQ